jgi:hypothetical protein
MPSRLAAPRSAAFDHLCHSTINFVVVHNAAFTAMW